MTVESSEINESAVEKIKRESNLLRGAIEEELATTAETFNADTAQLLKFHGVYLQDNRDVRSARKREGLDLEHLVMVRVAIPGGKLSADQYRSLDQLSDKFGNSTLRLTTRQGIQFHFATKAIMRELISEINQTLLTTWGGCGDVVRNVVACTNAGNFALQSELDRLADYISTSYKAPADSYWQIWIDGDRVPQAIVDAPLVDESLYGATMLPRKFKIGLTTTRDNCIDALSHDIAVVIDADEPSKLHIFAGGGMGRSGTDPSTYARAATHLGVVEEEDLKATLDAILTIQRDFGDRKDRAHARLKYTIDRLGIERFEELVVERSGQSFYKIPFPGFKADGDHLGIEEAPTRGRFNLGYKLPSGRVSNTGEVANQRSRIVQAIDSSACEVRVTAKGDLVFTELTQDDLAKVAELLGDTRSIDQIRSKRHIPLTTKELSFACVALPTCGLALAESERYLPSFVTELQGRLGELGAPDASIEVRITGCPNGCARPYLGELGIVGRSKKSYDIFIGADRKGMRLSEQFAVDVPSTDLVEAITPLLKLWIAEGTEKTNFGDFVTSLEWSAVTALAPAPRRRRQLSVQGDES